MVGSGTFPPCRRGWRCPLNCPDSTALVRLAGRTGNARDARLPTFADGRKGREFSFTH